MHKKAFTLIEIMIAILLVSIIMIGGFSALSAVTVGKVRLIEKTNIEKEAFYFSEKLFEMIKSGGTLDYEEYWNRKVVDDSSFAGGHFATPTGFGNFGDTGTPGLGGSNWGDGFYYCLSGDDQIEQMGGDGCLDNDKNTHSGSISLDTGSRDYSGDPQRYGQYALQFINFNINFDDDGGLPGDENGDGNIIGDDDDEYLGEGPEAFTSGVDVTELYLLSGDKTKRTFFRWNVIPDPDAPTSDCNTSDGGETFTGNGCLGTIQFLRLDGQDLGLNHIASNDRDGTQYDGIIDTWVIDPKFHSSPTDIIAGEDPQGYWQNLFPDTINVSDFEIYAYPNKDRELAWKEDENDVNIAPYIRLTLKLQPSWKKRKLIKGTIPELDLSTTISLSDLYSK